MPAQNMEMAEQQIMRMIEAATEAVQLQDKIFQVLESKEVVNQIWSDLGTDFPPLVQIDPHTSEEIVVLKGQPTIFKPQQIGTAQTRLIELSNYFQGDAMNLPGTLPNGGRDLRRLVPGMTV